MPGQNDDVRYDAFKKQLTFAEIRKRVFQNKIILIAFWIVAIIAFIMTGFLALMIIGLLVEPQSGGLFAVIFFLVILALPLLITRAIFLVFANKARQELYLAQFAKDNAFIFTPERDAASYAGAIFGVGSGRKLFQTITGSYKNMPFVFSNYRYTTGSGKSRRTHLYGVIRVTLSRHLPNVLLDARHNNFWKFSNLPDYRNRQKLQLEGDFNKYFDLYVPEGYERDALYFLTPELMQQLIDYGAKFDVEVIDNYLYIYSTKPFIFDKEETLRGIFNLINLIGSEFQENISRYSDARIGDRKANIVATPGRRLKRAFPWLTIIIVVIYIIFIFLPNS